MERNGWTCHIVEKYIKHPNMKFGRRIDAFGIGDILACRAPVFVPCTRCEASGAVTVRFGSITSDDEFPCPNCAGTGKFLAGAPCIALVQCFPDASFAEHRTKILAIPELQIWKAAGGKVFLQGWAKRGPRGQVKRWTMREEEL
jgi:hypothetical protein